MIAIFPEIAAASAQGDVERLAILVRKYFAGAAIHAPKLDVGSLVISAGVELQRLPLSGSTQAALLAKDERGAFTIVAVLKPSTSPAAQQIAAERFLLAHMLGHFLFDIQPVIARGEFQVSGYRESFCPMKRYSQSGLDVPAGDPGATQAAKQETRADDFAAAVLLPAGMTKKAFVSFKEDIERTAAFFGVTRACLGRRLTQLGILGTQPMNFLEAEQSLGYKAATQDPGEALATGDLDEQQLKAMQKAAGEHSVPRSYAALTYGQTEKSTARQTPKNTEPSASASKSVTSGMDRIRELARRLDKTK